MSSKSFLMLIALLPTLGCDDEQKTSQDDHPQEAILDNPEAPAPSGPLAPGQAVFDFTALAHTGQRVQLSEFLDKPVVVYFCSQNVAEVCTQLAQSFRDTWLELNSTISMVFGVSQEDTFVHRDFVSTNKLPLLMLADTEGSVHRVMGVRPGSVVSYLIGSDAKVMNTFTTLNPPTHARDILTILTQRTTSSPPATTAAPLGTGFSAQ